MTITPNLIAASVSKKVKQAKVAKAKRELDKRTARAVRMHSNAKRTIKAAEDRQKRAEAIIREGLGDAEIGVWEGIAIVEVMWSSNSRYDRDILTTRFPEAAAASYVKTPYSYLKTV